MTPPARGRGTSQRSPTVLVRSSQSYTRPQSSPEREKAKKCKQRAAALHTRRIPTISSHATLQHILRQRHALPLHTLGHRFPRPTASSNPPAPPIPFNPLHHRRQRAPICLGRAIHASAASAADLALSPPCIRRRRTDRQCQREQQCKRCSQRDQQGWSTCGATASTSADD
jgi:hypothetical protein